MFRGQNLESKTYDAISFPNNDITKRCMPKNIIVGAKDYLYVYYWIVFFKAITPQKHRYTYDPS